MDESEIYEQKFFDREQARKEAAEAELTRLRAELARITRDRDDYRELYQKKTDEDLVKQQMKKLCEQIEQMRSQLPIEMQSCTILFKSCPKGHGWLTATNWRPFDCLICERNELKAELEQMRSAIKLADEALAWAVRLRIGSFEEGWKTQVTGHQMKVIDEARTALAPFVKPEGREGEKG